MTHNGFRRRASLSVAVSAVLGIAADAALGQDDEIEEIMVTGSRIARPDFASASPIVSLTGDAFERTSATSVEAVVSRLPQFVPTFGSTSNNPGNGGQSNVQLRGLGLTSTLVLVDGRRVVPGNGDGVVDVNVIPPSLVESVEIISGGASAVYGSDAIAGVVNFKLKHDFEGLQFDGSWGQTDRGDGQEYNIGVTAGLSFADGRGDAYAYVGYTDRDDIFQGARDFSDVTLAYVGAGLGTTGPDKGFVPQGSTIVPEGRIGFSSFRPSLAAHNALFAKYGYAPGSVPTQQQTYSFNADRTVFAAGNRTPNSVANFRGEMDPDLFSNRFYSYNFGPINYLQLPLEQVSAFGRASFEVSPAAELYAQALYADYSASTALASTPANPLYVPATNPYIPDDLRFLAASRANPNADIGLGKRLLELGPRISSNQHDVWQATAGVQGEVFGDWRYDAYVQTGAYDQTDSQSGNALRSRILELTFAPDGGQSICGGLDLFGPDSISPECARYIAVDASNRSGFDQTVVEASLTGPVLALPAGDLSVAVGAMYKRDEYFYTADPIGTVFLEDGNPDIQGFSASDDIEGSDHNTDLYIEALIPLLADRPGVERLEAGLGYRFSDYASAGGVDAYKAELLYQPVEPMRVRGSYQRAVRAPTVFELYLPQLPTNYFSEDFEEFGFLDPCTAGSPQRTGPDGAEVARLCLDQGVPAALLPTFTDRDDEHRGVAGGNPDLDPETADTLTFGTVLQSWSDNPWFSAMQLSVDWYRIEVDDAISTVYAYEYVPLCFDSRSNPGFDVDNELCGYFARDSVTGEIEDFGDIYRNIVGYTVSGIDTQFDWRFGAGPGEVGVNWLVSWLSEFETREYEGLPPEDRVGRTGRDIGGSLPEWKWNLNLRYDWGPATVALQWRYIDGMRDIDWDYEVPSYDYFDVFASYEFEAGPLAGLTLRGGVENLADEDPPLLPTQVQANTDPSQYDVLGRRYYVNLSYRF